MFERLIKALTNVVENVDAQKVAENTLDYVKENVDLSTALETVKQMAPSLAAAPEWIY
ncbi:MAG: hypothetical protein R3240_03270 [Gammaproteobacteria bacterium]|nr:hypothetical protein [Gammaproteobacteria bacterium]